MFFPLSCQHKKNDRNHGLSVEKFGYVGGALEEGQGKLSKRGGK